MNTTLKQIGIKFGSIAAVLLIAAYLFFYFVDYKLMNSIIGGFILLFIVIAFGILSTYIAKQKLGGYLTFKEAFIPYFLTVAIGVLASTLFLFILYGLLDTETAALVKQDSIALTQQQMHNFGVPSEQAAQSVQMVTESNPYSFGTLLMSAATRVLMLCIPGLIVALAFRNKSEFISPKA